MMQMDADHPHVNLHSPRQRPYRIESGVGPPFNSGFVCQLTVGTISTFAPFQDCSFLADDVACMHTECYQRSTCPRGAFTHSITGLRHCS